MIAPHNTCVLALSLLALAMPPAPATAASAPDWSGCTSALAEALLVSADAPCPALSAFRSCMGALSATWETDDDLSGAATIYVIWLQRSPECGGGSGGRDGECRHVRGRCRHYQVMTHHRRCDPRPPA